MTKQEAKAVLAKNHFCMIHVMRKSRSVASLSNGKAIERGWYCPKCWRLADEKNEQEIWEARGVLGI